MVDVDRLRALGNLAAETVDDHAKARISRVGEAELGRLAVEAALELDKLRFKCEVAQRALSAIVKLSEMADEVTP